MPRLTFEIDAEMKKQFLLRMVSESRKSIKSVLTELCQQYIDCGVVDVAELQADLQRYFRLLDRTKDIIRNGCSVSARADILQEIDDAG